jgi:acyl-coenzyme A synthetase/AMP-(fatty) acid ligase
MTQTMAALVAQTDIACRMQVLATAGEPINPEAWRWYHEVVGEKRCPVIDTWWQTETGGNMISPLPVAGGSAAWKLKPGSVTRPFFGAAPVLLHPDTHEELHGAAEGVLCFKQACANAFIDPYSTYMAGHSHAGMHGTLTANCVFRSDRYDCTLTAT